MLFPFRLVSQFLSATIVVVCLCVSFVLSVCQAALSLSLSLSLCVCVWNCAWPLSLLLERDRPVRICVYVSEAVGWRPRDLSSAVLVLARALYVRSCAAPCIQWKHSSQQIPADLGEMLWRSVCCSVCTRLSGEMVLHTHACMWKGQNMHVPSMMQRLQKDHCIMPSCIGGGQIIITEPTTSLLPL